MWSQLSDLSLRGERFIIATVTDTGGSTPRKLGAQLVITLHTIIGTIGGGAIEQRIINEARHILNSPPQRSSISWVSVHLSHDLGMCCGGNMTIMLHDHIPYPKLYIFGAGHIGTSLAQVSLIAGFKVSVIDDREEWADETRFPVEIEVICDDPEHFLKSSPLTSADYAVITTYDHGLDERLIAALSVNPLTYLGLIGSKAKWARFEKRLQARSDLEYLSRVQCPMGINIGAHTPEEIAVSVTAELISTRRQSPHSHSPNSKIHTL